MASLPREPNPINPIRTVSIGGQVNPIASCCPKGRSGANTTRGLTSSLFLGISAVRNKPIAIPATTSIAVNGKYFFIINRIW